MEALDSFYLHNHDVIDEQIDPQFAGKPLAVVEDRKRALRHRGIRTVIDLRPDGIDSFTLEPPAFQLHRWNGSRLFSYTVNVGDFDGPFPFH